MIANRLRTLYDLTLLLHTPWNIARTRAARVVLLIAVALGLLIAVAPANPASAAESVASVSARGPALPIKGKAPKTGFSRAQFGPAWADVDRNGCDTRNDILQRDLTGETFKPRTHNCVVLTGTLVDPYTGKKIQFARGPNSRAVEVDHVVSLSNAWQTGAQQLTPQQRWAFANDPLNLLAVDGPTNQQKGAGDAATWLPQRDRQGFVARQIQVKQKYHLWVTPAEYAAMARYI